MKGIDWKHALITGAVVLVVLVAYDKWLGPMITKKVG
jgi:hypothetical protein